MALTLNLKMKPSGAVNLSQIVMESPGTQLVKNHEFQSRTNKSHLKKNESDIENAWAFM